MRYGGDYNPEQWPEARLAGGPRAHAAGRRQPRHRRRLPLVTAGADARARTTSTGSTGCSTCLHDARGRRGAGDPDRLPAAVVQPGPPRRAAGQPRRRAPRPTAPGTPTASTPPPTATAARASRPSWPSATPGHPALRAVARAQRVRHVVLLRPLRGARSGTGCATATARSTGSTRPGRPTFWSQRYGDWAQVLPPRATQYLPNPAQELDYRRFPPTSCWPLSRAARRARAADRAGRAGHHQLRARRLGAGRPLRAGRAEVDLVAIDHYPSDADGARARSRPRFAADLAPRLGRRRHWLLMEHAPNLHRTPAAGCTPRRPGGWPGTSLVARGPRLARARCSSSGGPRSAAPSSSTRRWCRTPDPDKSCGLTRRSLALGASLQKLGTVEGRVAAPAALVWTPNRGGLCRAPVAGPDLDYWGAGRSVHGALWRAGVTTDVVSRAPTSPRTASSSYPPSISPQPMPPPR